MHSCPATLLLSTHLPVRLPVGAAADARAYPLASAATSSSSTQGGQAAVLTANVPGTPLLLCPAGLTTVLLSCPAARCCTGGRLHYIPQATTEPANRSQLATELAALATWRQQHKAKLPRLVWMDTPVQVRPTLLCLAGWAKLWKASTALCMSWNRCKAAHCHRHTSRCRICPTAAPIPVAPASAALCDP